VRAGEIELTGGVFASDANSGLINLYQHVQSNMSELIPALKELSSGYNQCINKDTFYYLIRARFTALQNDDRYTASAAAMFLFLNKTCFRGLYREGPKGFNVPFGHYPAPSVFDEGELMAVSDLIQGVEFACQDVQHSLLGVGTDDFIYLDPPYAPETATSFVGYTSNGFSLEDHRTLFARIKNLTLTKFLLSNADVPLVTEAFAGYQKKVVMARRAINSKKPESRTKEVLIWN
jgi:DNA adenine methylase